MEVLAEHRQLMVDFRRPQNSSNNVSIRRPHPGPDNLNDTVQDNEEYQVNSPSNSNEDETLADFAMRRPAESTATEWTCESCTSVNRRRRSICEMCGGPRNRQEGSEAPNTGSSVGLSEITSRFSTQISRTSSSSSHDMLRLRSRSPDHIIERFLNHLRGRRPSSWQRVLFDNDDGVGDGVTRAASEARSTMINLARHTLLEIPSAAINALQVGFFSITGNTFNGVTREMVSSWYREQRRPLFEEICRRLQLESTEEGSERVFNVLIAFLRQHRCNEDLLRRFLRYSTGSTNAIGDSIRANISSSVMAISHATYFLSMELPMIVDDREAEQAFAASRIGQCR